MFLNFKNVLRNVLEAEVFFQNSFLHVEDL